MASIAIRVSSISTDGASLTIGYEIVPKISGALLAGDVSVPFDGDPNGVNVGIVGSAKAIMTAAGNPVGPTDTVMLIGGVTAFSVGTASHLAHVVMKGASVDSVFTDDAAAQGRAAALAVATEGEAQEDAIKAAPRIASVPLDPM